MNEAYLASSFDLLNVADLDLIDQARGRCDRLTVGVFSDQYVERTTGRKPVVSIEERTALLRCVRGVDQVVVHDEADLGRLIADGTVFAVEGVHYEDRMPSETVWLRAARETDSVALRRSLASLRPPTRSAVA